MPSSIISASELARTIEAELGGSPVARRRWAVNFSDNTLADGGPPTPAAIATKCVGSANIFGISHPDVAYYRLKKFSITERFEDDPYKAEAVAEYGILNPDDWLAPDSRPARWSFESRPSEIATLWYYHGNGNEDQRPLTNTAYDFFPGMTREETLTNIKITKNFFRLRKATPNDVTPNVMDWLSKQNFVNSVAYSSLGAGKHTIKVVGVDAAYTSEEFNGQQLSYYETTATLQFRESTHNLLLPDIGFNFIDQPTGQKRRAMVFDFQNNEWVATANPVGLNGTNGSQTFGVPGLLTRRVNPEADLQAVFGQAPTDT